MNHPLYLPGHVSCIPASNNVIKTNMNSKLIVPPIHEDILSTNQGHVSFSIEELVDPFRHNILELLYR